MHLFLLISEGTIYLKRVIDLLGHYYFSNWLWFISIMDDQQYPKGEKQQMDIIEGLESLPIPAAQYSSSQSDYFQLFDSSRISQSSHLGHIQSGLIRELKEEYEIYYEQKFISEMEFTVAYQSANYEVIKLNLTYGRFRTSLLIINVDENSPSQELLHVASGNFGSVYEAYFRSRYAIKSIPIKQGKFQQAIKSVLREAFILKIASALKIGPFIANIYGFDLVIYANCIEFSMEFCDKYENNQARNISQLMDKMYLLHKYHIVHNDIKPENIAYSRYYEQYVIIDFGLSKILKQAVGEKTMTAFVGSLQYCSPQMASLFVDSSIRYINLYRNDVFALKKSIRVIQSTSKNGLQIDDQHASYRFGSAKFNQYQYIIYFKSLLFKISLTSSSIFLKQITWKRQQQQQSAYRKNIRNFLLCIPYSELLAQLYTNYCEAKGQEDILKMFSTKKSIEFLDNISNLFVDRTKALISHSSNDCQDDQKIHNFSLKPSQLSIDQWTLQLVKLIKINGNTENFQEKVQACRNYGRFRWHPFDTIQDEPSFYKAVIQNIFNQVMEDFGMPKARILRQIIQTIIILEIVPQQRLNEAFITFIRSGLSIIETIGLSFEILSGLQFTKDRLNTTYGYEELTESLLIQLNSYIDKMHRSKIIRQNELSIMFRMKQIIMKKIDYALQTFENKSPLSNAVDFHFNFFAKSDEERLLHDIETYLVCTQTLRLLSQNKLVHTSNVRYIKHEVIKTHQGSGHFGYLHLVLFEESYLKREDSLNGLYYHLFQTQLSPFPEHKQFKTYFKSIFCRVRRAKMTPYSEVQPPNIGRNENNSLSLAAEGNLFKEIQQIIEGSNDILFCINNLISMNYLFDSRQDFIQIINRLIQKSKHFIFVISKNYHKNSIHHHDNRHRRQIDAISFLIGWCCQPRLDVSEIQNNFLYQSRRVLKDSKCLTCKATCLFQLKLRESQYLLMRNQTEQSLDIFSQCCEMCLKYSQFNHEFCHVISRVMHILLRITWDLQMHNIFQFIYEVAKSLNDFSCCFSQMGEMSVLNCIYASMILEGNVMEITNFIFSILNIINIRQSIQLINQFYYNFKKFIQSLYDQQLKESFKQFHDIVVQQMLLRKQFQQLPQLAIYFCILLLVKVKGPLDEYIFRSIVKSLNKIHPYSKYLILAKYYILFTFYFDLSKRKTTFLILKHLKYNLQQKITLKEVVKNKIRSKKQYKKGKPFQYLKQAVKRYHFIIGNCLN